jgi:hypothetical protein
MNQGRFAGVIAATVVVGFCGPVTAKAAVVHHHQLAQPRGGWMARDANRKHAWLYVNGEDNNVVYIHDLDRIGFPEVGRITDGVNAPFGMAVDAAGTLYVVNQHGPGSAPGNVTIYPAGATSPSLTLSQGLFNPQGVAVNAGGDVYVTNRGQSPGIAIYAAGQTTLAGYITDALISRPIQDFFDVSGNLYFSDPDTGVSEIPQGSEQPVSLGLQGLTHAGGITIDPHSGRLFVNDWLGGMRYATHVYAPGNPKATRNLQRNIAGYYLTTGRIQNDQFVFVPAFYSNLVYLFKGNAKEPTATLRAASQAGSVAYKPAGVP